VKQWCEPKQFIAINDEMEMHARVFIPNNLFRGRSRTAERQKERESERQSVAGNER
jgi:hypothetical protein